MADYAESSKVFGVPIKLNGTTGIQMNGGNNVQVLDGNGNYVDCVAFNVENAAVNRIEFNSSAAGSDASIQTTGDDTDINLQIGTKGGGVLAMNNKLVSNQDFLLSGAMTANSPSTGDKTVLQVSAEDDAVNFVNILAGATGNQTTLAAMGDDTDVDLQLSAKNAGYVSAQSDLAVGTGNIFTSSPSTGLRKVVGLTAVDNSVNFVELHSSTTGNSVILSGSGDDTDIDVLVQPKGAGSSLITNFESLGSEGQKTAFSFASTELTNLSGADVVASNLIPAGAFLLGITTFVTSDIGTSNGTTGYQVGDGDVDRWGDITGTVQGTSTDNTNATADTTAFYTAASDVTITAVGGNFDGTGNMRVVAHYISLTAPTN